jgi:hypothetical protein
MTVSLLARAKSLDTKLSEFDIINSNMGEIEAFTQAYKELDAVMIPFLSAFKAAEMMSKNGMDFLELDSLVNLKKMAGQLFEKFRDSGDSKTLKSGKNWPTIISAITSTTRDLNSSSLNIWKNYKNNIFTGEKPDNLVEITAPTSHNKSILLKYRSSYAEFINLFDRLPDNEPVISRARELAIILANCRGQLDFDVPSEVKKFLDATSTFGGAGISSLSDSVLAWLRDNNTIENYKVVSK